MKNIIKTIAISSIIFLSISCYKDKGSYEYTSNADDLTISESMKRSTVPGVSPFNFVKGEPIRISAKYTINNTNISDKDLSFKWLLGGEVVGTDSVLILKDLKPAKYTGILEILNNRNKMVYQSQYEFSINPKYLDGWYIGSQKDNYTRISYLRLNSEDQEKIKDYVYEEGIFDSFNNKKLEGGVKYMNTHLIKAGSSGLSVVQPTLGAIDISCQSMEVISDGFSDFISDPSSAIKDVIYAYENVYAITNNGNLYIREEGKLNDAIVPHITFFSALPVAISGGSRITKWANTSIMANFFGNYATILAYDELNSRLLRILGQQVIPLDNSFYTGNIFSNNDIQHRGKVGWDGTKEYPDIKFPEVYNFEDYNVLAMNAGGSDVNDWSGYRSISYCLLLERKTDMKKFFYTFRMFDDTYDLDLNNDLFFPVPETLNIDAQTILTTDNIASPNHCFYFTANGNHDIYYFHLVKGDIKKVYHSDVEITGIGLGEKGNVSGFVNIYKDKMLIATADNKLHVVKMDDAALVSGQAEEIKVIDTNIGKITNIIYTTNTFIGY